MGRIVLNAFTSLLRREIGLSLSRGFSFGIGVAFFLSLVILFPFGIGPDPETLRIVGPAILWTAPLLSILLGIEQSFQPDIEDGSLDIYRLGQLPVSGIVIAKALSSWLTSALPLICLAPLFGMMLGMSGNAILGCVISLLVGSPAIVFFGIFCGALTSQIPRAGMLTTIIAVPFLIPTLIFGVMASVGYYSPSQSFMAPVLILAAISLLAAVICTWASALVMGNK